MTAAAQLALDLSPLTEPDYTPELTLDERFDLFHAANPHVADALEHLAEAWLSSQRSVGVKALYERLRWAAIETHNDPYRLNNSYTSRYARLLLARRPEGQGRIEVRALAKERAGDH